MGFFPYRSNNPSDMLMSYLSVGTVGFITFLLLTLLFIYAGITIWQALFYCVCVVLHPVVSSLLLMFTAPKIIPCPSSNALNRIKNSIKLLLSFFSGSPRSVWVIQNGKLTTRISGNPVYGSGPGWLLTEPEKAVILGNGYQLTRIPQPGAAVTRESETPHKIVNLRNQRRQADVIAVTRDGIEVIVPVSFSFRIDSGPKRPGLNHPWPIHKRDIYQAVFAEVVDPNGKTPLDEHLPHPWEDLPLTVARYKVKQAVSFYSLLQLYDHSDFSSIQSIHKRVAEALDVDLVEFDGYGLTRVVISHLVVESVRKILSPHGFAIYDGGIKKSFIPVSKELTRQRVEAWKSQWISKVMQWQTETPKNLLKSSKDIDGQSLLDEIELLIDKISSFTDAPDVTNARKKMAGCLLDKFVELSHIPEVKPLLPDSVYPTLSQLQMKNKES
jgi:hypothetical protein